MSFDYSFMYAGDEVYVAYTVPYTYTQMQTHIKHLKLLSDEYRKSRIYPWARYQFQCVSMFSFQVHKVWDDG